MSALLEHTILELMTRVADLEHRVSALESKKKTTAKLNIGSYDPEIVAMVKRLREVWPKSRQDGGRIDNDTVMAAARVTDLLSRVNVKISDLEESALDYIASRPPYANAIQFYFGPGKDGMPPWERELRAWMTRNASD